MKITELRNQSISVEHQAGDGNGIPEMWRLLLTDKQSGDVIFCAFPPEVKQELVRMMMGGVVVPVPKMTIPKGKT